MTKYRKSTLVPGLALALAALVFSAGQAFAGPLDEAFAPRAVPGVEYASLDIPVAQKAQPMAAPAPRAAQPAPYLPPAAPEEKSFWQRTKDFFGF